MTKKVWTYIVGILLIVGGVLLFLSPEQTLNNLIYYFGLILLITSIVKILSMLINKLGSYFYFGSILNLLFGIILMNNSDMTLRLISIFIGIWLILSASSGLIVILNLKGRNTIDNSLLATNILKLILGIIVLVVPSITSIFTGVLLGIILILIGIYTIFNDKKTTNVYKVKIKK